MSIRAILPLVCFLVPSLDAQASMEWHADPARQATIKDAVLRECRNEWTASLRYKHPLDHTPAKWNSVGQSFSFLVLQSEAKKNDYADARKALQGFQDALKKEPPNTLNYPEFALTTCAWRVALAEAIRTSGGAATSADGASKSDKPLVPSPSQPPATGNRQPPKITTVASLGNGCVTAMGRNHRLNEFDKSAHSIDVVLKNSCGKSQVVKVDVTGFGTLTWPGVFNIGQWASTANADVPAGTPFKPIISLAEGGSYMVPANGEISNTWQVPRPIGSDNELKVWIGSCDAYSSSGMKQVVFRPATHFERDARAFCGPSRLR